MEITKLDHKRTHESEGPSIGTVIYKTQPFPAWYRAKTGNSLGEDVSGLSFAERRKIFLKWKHGLESDKANSDQEASEKETLLLLSNQGVSRMKGDAREYFKRKIMFEYKCNAYRSILGLTEIDIPVIEDETP